jgi:hypothetical protein
VELLGTFVEADAFARSMVEAILPTLKDVVNTAVWVALRSIHAIREACIGLMPIA